MIDTLLGRLSTGKDVLSPGDNEGGAAFAPVTVKGESSGADLSAQPFFSSACPKEDSVSANEAKRLTARLVLVFILMYLFVFVCVCLCLCLDPPFFDLVNETQSHIEMKKGVAKFCIDIETQSHLRAVVNRFLKI